MMSDQASFPSNDVSSLYLFSSISSSFSFYVKIMMIVTGDLSLEIGILHETSLKHLSKVLINLHLQNDNIYGAIDFCILYTH